MTPPATSIPLRVHRGAPVLGLAVLLGACTAAAAQGKGAPPTAPPPSRSSAQQELATIQEKEGGTLQVTGQAQVTVPADRAIISFAVETEAPNAQDAVRENANRMDAVISALRQAGVDGIGIETFGYNLYPDYRFPSRDSPGTREIAAYRAQNNIKVTLPDVESAGTILDAATEAGANRVQSLQFEASNLEPARREALAQAVRTAREEAETMARAMGIELGPVLTVQGGASIPGPRILARAAFAQEAAGAQTPIEAGGQVVTASVSITYRIREQAP